MGVGRAFALAVVLAIVLRWTVFGRHLSAMGPKEQTTRLRGVKVTTIKLVIDALAGLFIGVAGVTQVAKLSSGNWVSGLGVELKVTAAVVIGGDSLSGGQGSVLGTLAGVCHQGRHREWLHTAGPLRTAAGL